MVDYIVVLIVLKRPYQAILKPIHVFQRYLEHPDPERHKYHAELTVDLHSHPPIIRFLAAVQRVVLDIPTSQSE